MVKIVLKVELHGDKMRQKAMKRVAAISGVASVSVDMKDNKMTITGDIDPVCVVRRLRKLCYTDIVSVGPEKEDKTKEDEKIIEDQTAYYHHMIMGPPPPYISCAQDPPGCVICYSLRKPESWM